MNKFFKDNDLSPQKVSEDIARRLFGIPGDDIVRAVNELSFIVIKTINAGPYSIQIFINTTHVLNNNIYNVLVFDTKDELLTMFSQPSHTVLPPVWEKVMGIDYLDYLSIQCKFNQLIEQNKDSRLEKIELDQTTEGKMFYYSADKNAMELAEKGEPYQIVSVFAEKVPKMVEEAKAFIGREYSVKL